MLPVAGVPWYWHSIADNAISLARLAFGCWVCRRHTVSLQTRVWTCHNHMIPLHPGLGGWRKHIMVLPTQALDITFPYDMLEPYTDISAVSGIISGRVAFRASAGLQFRTSGGHMQSDLPLRW